MNKYCIPIITKKGKSLVLEIYPESENTYREISDEEAKEFGESKFQLCEGKAYQYAFNSTEYQFIIYPELKKVISVSAKHPNEGRITPGIYTGTLQVKVCGNNDACDTAEINLEVRSIKTDYRKDYRFMLEEITEKCTDLLMMHSSPVVQKFQVSHECDSRTLYQRFAFVKSIIQSEDFLNSVHKIISSPTVKWKDEEEYTDIRNARRIDRKALRQIASAPNRIKLPDSHYLKQKDIVDSLPQRIRISRKSETVDTPENRFIKHTLLSYIYFVSSIKDKFKDGSREKLEAENCENILEDFISHSLFKEVSQPNILALNNPVLHRKEGYREVYKSWLMFDLASKLIWQGGEDVFSAGKRDIATLYEYWLFFKLLDVFSGIFNIKPDSIEELTKTTKDELGLQLKAGTHFPIKGTCNLFGRLLNIQFSFNRTFSGKTDYPNGGSWTVSMRPDYTLSIWPDGFDETEAELQENIVHIHFDAKYKIENITSLFETQGAEDLNSEESEQKEGKYKRGDLLKMHAYKDAVRRTAGAYVLYPGDIKMEKKGFHELIPGLGAFAIKPSIENSGEGELKKFIIDVVENYLSRSSQQEQMSYHTFNIHKKRNDGFVIKDALPEKYGLIRSKPPSEISVLVGYYRSENKNWISDKKLYNIRFEKKIISNMIQAKYLLLYHNGSKTGDLWEITSDAPRLWSKEQLKHTGYKNPSKAEYFIYSLKAISNPEFKGCRWDVSKLKGYNKRKYPFAVSLLDLMKERL